MEAFLYVVFMAIVSFAVGTIVWVAVNRFFGYRSSNARLFSFLLVPVAVLAMDFAILVAGRWGYLVGAIPLVLIAGYALYYRFGNNGAYYDAPAPSDFKRAESSKSRRIREAREKRQQQREAYKEASKNTGTAGK